ncbi:DSD1 family PLP-dependent enzyme [Pyruvatibacter mobilis]|uniref:DSD1 family PLP-dependent enzyme n=1 Tax=Pyruvatibacter mobilis TaxID=1712261 RepID=UPI003BAB5636
MTLPAEEAARLTPNAHMLGQQGSARALNTPALVLDLDLFDRNLSRMMAHCEASGLGLRPHAKTHKSIEIARRQLDAGAVGICVAKLGEAEVMGRGGIDSVLITSPVVKEDAIRRLIALNNDMPDLMVCVDNIDNAEELARAASPERGNARALKVLVDLDVGLHRTGIGPGEGAAKLAAFIAASPGLEFKGLQAYAGHLMHVADYIERRDKSLAAMKMLGDMRDMLLERSISCDVLTGGGTGTWDIDPEAGVLTDLQAGSYLFMDTEYNAVSQKDGAAQAFETSLTIQTTVVSANTPGIATTDAGIKSMATDHKEFRIASGAPEGTAYFLFGDEQGGLLFSDKKESEGGEKHSLKPGAVLNLETPHCDPTVNLYECYHVVQNGTLVDIWPIDTRGRSA